MKTIAETAVETPALSTLVAALKAANWVEPLMSGEYTVFAPNNDAFAKLPEGALDGLLGNVEELAKILKFHVVEGKWMASDITSGKVTEAKTLEGGMLHFDASNGVKVNDATVVMADVECTNGVVHVIDSVLMP